MYLQTIILIPIIYVLVKSINELSIKMIFKQIYLADRYDTNKYYHSRSEWIYEA